MKFAIVIALCIVAVTSFRRERPDFDCNRWCTKYGYDPKCSIDGKTYTNDCFLECEWNYKDCDGPCPCSPPKPPKPIYCYCKPDYDPVCTTGGDTYDNKCEAECEGKVVWYDGKCH